MNSGTMKFAAPSPKASSAPFESVTLPPAAVTTAWGMTMQAPAAWHIDRPDNLRPLRPARKEHPVLAEALQRFFRS